MSFYQHNQGHHQQHHRQQHHQQQHHHHQQQQQQQNFNSNYSNNHHDNNNSTHNSTKLPSPADVLQAVMRQGEFDTLRKKLSQFLRTHELVTQLTADTRLVVERHPHVAQMMRMGTESTLLAHGVLGAPELATRAQINQQLFNSPAYRELRESIRRLLSAPAVAADVMAAIDRAAQTAIDLANNPSAAATLSASTNAVAEAGATPAVAASTGVAAGAAVPQTLLVNQLLARKVLVKPVAKPVARLAAAQSSRTKTVTKTTIIVPYDALMIARRRLQAAERGDASSESDDDIDDDIDDDDDSSSSSGPAAAASASVPSKSTPAVDDAATAATATDATTTTAAAAAVAAVAAPPKFSCETCGQGFRRKRDMSSHMTNQHGAAPTSELHVCADCPMAFAYPNKLAKHRQSRHGVAAGTVTVATDSVVEQAKVDEPTGAVDEMAEDVAPPTDEKGEKSRRKRRRREAAASAAAATVDEQPETADVPATDAVGADAADVAPIVKSKPFVCEQCDARFDRKSRLERHVAADHAPPPTTDEAEPGSVAVAVAAAEEKIDAQAAAIAAKRHVCTQCDARFDRRSRLDKHIAQAHTTTGEPVAAVEVAADDAPSELYACEHCDQRFKRKSALDRHVGQAHPPAKPAESAEVAAAVDAPVVDETVPVSDATATVEVPVVKNSDAKKWACDECSACFDRKGKLASHKESIHRSGKKSAPTPKRRRDDPAVEAE